MESFEKWAGIYSPANSKDDMGCTVLEPLESGKIFRWEDRKHGIAVIESRCDKCMSNMVTSVLINVSVNSPEISHMKRVTYQHD